LNGRQAGTPWKTILGLCDEAEELRARTRDAAEPSANGLRAEIRRRRTELRALLEKEVRAGALAEVAGGRKLSLDECEIIAMLLRRYVDSRSPWLTGREILERIADDTFSKLRAIAIVGPEGTLRTEGLVATERPARGADPLDTRFRLSDAAAALFFEAPPRPVERRRTRKTRPYRSNREYLLDLRELAELCRRRAHAIFGPPDNDGYRPTRDERRNIERKIRVTAERVEQDLRATPEREKFPMIAFQSEFALTAEESLVVVDLLFAELFEGEGSLEVVDLLQLVSRTPEDLLRRRRLLGPESVLVRRGIVVLEEAEEERETTGRICLERWVVDRVLGDDTQGRAIAPDERIDFHLYLKDLDSSARFYRDLAGGDDSERA